MELNLFHASTDVYCVDQHLTDARPTIGSLQLPTNAVLERYRRGRSTCRSVAYFATSNPADSVYFLQAKQRREKPTTYLAIHLYRVEMPVTMPHPMSVIDLVRKAIESIASESCLQCLAEEYWEPKHSWKFSEYMAKSMTVREKLSLPDAGTIGGAASRYIEDHDLATKLWQTTVHAEDL